MRHYFLEFDARYHHLEIFLSCIYNIDICSTLSIRDNGLSVYVDAVVDTNAWNIIFNYFEILHVVMRVLVDIMTIS